VILDVVPPTEKHIFLIRTFLINTPSTAEGKRRRVCS
jgi:hypothetical protein